MIEYQETLPAFFSALGDASQRRKKFDEWLTDDAIYEYPDVLQAHGKTAIADAWDTRSNGPFATVTFTVERISGVGDRWYVERSEHLHGEDGSITHTVAVLSVLQFSGGRIQHWIDYYARVAVDDRISNGNTADEDLHQFSMEGPPHREESRRKVKLRSKAQIQNTVHRLIDTVWRDRHRMYLDCVKAGRLKIVPDAKHLAGDIEEDEVPVSIWANAVAHGDRITEALGPDLVGPYTSYEWGRICGHLGALRWVLGDDWNNQDT